MTDHDKLTNLYDAVYRNREATLGALREMLAKDDPSVAYATTWKVTPALVAEAKYALVVPAWRAVNEGRMDATEALGHLADQATKQLLRARADGSTSTGDRLAEHAGLQGAAELLDLLRW